MEKFRDRVLSETEVKHFLAVDQVIRLEAKATRLPADIVGNAWLTGALYHTVYRDPEAEEIGS